jgi:hypothetical protein
MIMTGEKRYFLNKDVPVVLVQKLNKITVEEVLAKVYHLREVRAYLPDFETYPERKMNRDFLFGIVNKLDPTFFARAVRDAAAMQPVKPEDETKRKTLVVQPAVLKMLKETSKMVSARPSQAHTTALASMLTSTKKRKRREMGERQALPTEFVLKRQRF